MSDTLILNLSALIALLPLSLFFRGKPKSQSALFWLLLLVAVVGPGILLVVGSQDGWHSDLSGSIWITIVASLALYSLISITIQESWRLGIIFAPYMFILGLFAVIWAAIGNGAAANQPLSVSGWVALHIFVSVTTYALVTIAAVAALAAGIQERALKARQQPSWGRELPSLADCDRLVMKTLILGEAVLALGMLSGMALYYTETDALFAFNHKSVLALSAFVVIGGLLIAHFKSGLRGRKAARVVLLVYLLLTLSYPGVKIVTDVILAG